MRVETGQVTHRPHGKSWNLPLPSAIGHQSSSVIHGIRRLPHIRSIGAAKISHTCIYTARPYTRLVINIRELSQPRLLSNVIFTLVTSKSVNFIDYDLCYTGCSWTRFTQPVTELRELCSWTPFTARRGRELRNFKVLSRPWCDSNIIRCLFVIIDDPSHPICHRRVGTKKNTVSSY